MEQEDFSNVSWHTDRDGGPGGSASAPEPQRRSEYPAAGRVDGARAIGDEEDRLQPTRGDEILECIISDPHKENDGTKDAYVSYTITTNAGPRSTPLSILGVFRANFTLPHSQHSQPSNGRRPLYAADSPTSSFSTRCYVEITRAAPCRRCRTNSGWNTSGVTASVQTSQRVAATPSSGSSPDYHCTRSSVEPRSSTPSSRAPTGMRRCEAGQCGGHLHRQGAWIWGQEVCPAVVGLPSLPAEAEAAYSIPSPTHS
jgi:hypothetical protein